MFVLDQDTFDAAELQAVFADIFEFITRDGQVVSSEENSPMAQVVDGIIAYIDERRTAVDPDTVGTAEGIIDRAIHLVY